MKRLYPAATCLLLMGCATIGLRRFERAPTRAPLESEIRRIERQLRNGKPDQRQRAATMLMDREEALPALRRIVLDASDPDSQRALLIELARRRDDRFAPELVRLAVSAAPDRARLARVALAAALDERVGSAIGEAVADPKRPVRARLAAIELVQIAPHPAVAPALVHVLSEPDERLRAAALNALQRLTGSQLGPNPESWEHWLEANRGKTRDEWLLDRIAELQNKLEKIGQERDKFQAEAATQTISALSLQPESISQPALTEALKSHHASVRAYAIRELSRRKQIQRETLCELMSDPSAEVRAAAVEAFGGVANAGDVGVLRHALADPSALVRQRAVEALGRLPSDRVIQALLHALSDPDLEVRAASAEALGALGDARAVPLLCNALNDDSPKTRGAAAAALGKLKDARAVKSLCQASNDASDRVRWYVADSLGRIGVPFALPSLLKLLRDPNARVRESAAVALGKLANTQAIGPLTNALEDSDARVRAQAADALSAIAAADPHVLLQVANAFYATQETKRAVGAYERWCALDPKRAKKSPDVRMRLGKCYLSAKNWGKAAPIFESLLKERPTAVDLRLDLSQCLYESKHYDRLLEFSAAWLNQLPSRSAAWWSIRLRVVQAYAAEQQFAKVVELVDAFANEDPSLGGAAFRGKLQKLRADAQNKLAQTGTEKHPTKREGP